MSSPRRRYDGRVHRDTQRLRVVGLPNRETGQYHPYVTNVPPDGLPAEDINTMYSLRWQIDMLFKELKSDYWDEDMPSGKRVVVETLLYAAFLRMVVSRRLLALLRHRLSAMADRISAPRWAAVLLVVAHDLLATVLRPPRNVKTLRAKVQRGLLHENVDPNAVRHALLIAVEMRTHRHHPAVATARIPRRSNRMSLAKR